MAADPHAAMLQAALALQQQGNFKEARRKYESIIARDPRNFNALQLCGVVAIQQEAYRDAVKLIRRALALRGNDAPVLTNLGIAHQNLRQTAEALECFDKAIAAKPDFASAHHNRANLLREAKRYAEARESYHRAIALQPDNYLIHANHASVLYDLDEYEAALEALGKALALRPDYPTAHFRKGKILLELDKPAEALAAFDHALRLRADDGEFLIGRGKALMALDRHEEGLTSHRRAIELAPKNAAFVHASGLAFLSIKRIRAALACFEEALALKPDHVEAHVSSAYIHKNLGLHDKALAQVERAIKAKPDDRDALLCKGSILAVADRTEEALEIYQELSKREPDDAHVQFLIGQTLNALHQRDEADLALRQAVALIAGKDENAERVQAICAAVNRVSLLPAAYRDEAELVARREELLRALHQAQSLLQETGAHSKAMESAFATTAFATNGFYIAYQQENDVAPNRLLSDCISRMLAIPEHPAREAPRKPGPIRFGIASEKLYRHNGSSWALPWLKHLPPDYQFFSYAFHGLHDDVSDGFAELGTHRRLSFDAGSLAKTIAAMRADDLDFLMLPDIGMTPSSRILSVHRIAPVQFTAWGHPVTSGSPAMDFYLSSDLMEPDDAAAHYSETLIRLPNLALYLEPGSTAPPTKDFPLPEGRVLYGCLQSLFKYLPRYDDILPRIASQVPKALFVFIEGMSPHMTGITRARLDAAFVNAGLSAAQHMVFLPRVNGAEFDALTRQMDVLVDSLGWSGGNTTLGAIEASVPLITCPGAFMRGRHSYAMFRMMDMPSAIAGDTDEMVQKLIALGREPDRRQAMREELGQRKDALYADKSLIAALDGSLKDQFAKL
jgi:predicted O-linked N-acetylglucosamine transferase (SPINDLY family)